MNVENKDIKDLILETDELHGEMLVAVEDICTPMHFLIDFFNEPELAYDSKDGAKRFRALDLIHNFRHYRYMFALLNSRLSDIRSYIDDLGKLINQAHELTKNNTELRTV